MGSPNAQKDDSRRLEIVCAIIQEVIKENDKEKKKPGEFTIVENQGRKDDLESQITQSLEQVIKAGAVDNECGYDSKNNTMIRIVNNRKISVSNKNPFKGAYKEMKEKGKTYLQEKQKEDYDKDEK